MLRLTGGVGRLEGESGITLLGLQPEALVQLNGWRDSDADASRSELARRIEVPSTLAGVRLSETLTVLRGADVGWQRPRSSPRSRGRRGRFFRVRLGDEIPSAARGGRLAGIVLEPATRLQERGADAGQALKGIGLGAAPRRAGRVRRVDRGWRGEARGRDDPLHADKCGHDAESDPANWSTASRCRCSPRRVSRPPRTERGLLPLQIAGERLTVRVVAHCQPLPRRRRPGRRRRRRSSRWRRSTSSGRAQRA